MVMKAVVRGDLRILRVKALSVLLGRFPLLGCASEMVPFSPASASFFGSGCTLSPAFISRFRDMLMDIFTLCRPVEQGEWSVRSKVDDERDSASNDGFTPTRLAAVLSKAGPPSGCWRSCVVFDDADDADEGSVSRPSQPSGATRAAPVRMTNRRFFEPLCCRSLQWCVAPEVRFCDPSSRNRCAAPWFSQLPLPNTQSRVMRAHDGPATVARFNGRWSRIQNTLCVLSNNPCCLRCCCGFLATQLH